MKETFPISDEMVYDRIVPDDCSFLREELGFQIIETLWSESFGGDALVVLATEGLQVRFVRDRGQLFFDLRPDGTEKWYSIDLVRALIRGRKAFHAIMDKENAGFVRDHFQQILQLISPERVNDTTEKLEKLKRSRMKMESPHWRSRKT